MDTKKTVTVGEVVEAMRANGLPKHQGWQKRNGFGEIEAACSIAQAAIRLEVDWHELEAELNKIEVFNGEASPTPLGSFIIHVNDSTEHTVSYIGAEAARRVQALRLMPLRVDRATYKVAAGAMKVGG